MLAVPQGLIVAVLTGPHSQTGLHLQLGRTRSSAAPRSPDEQGGEVPVLLVIVSQGQNLLLPYLVASLGGKSELLGKIGIHCIPIVSRDVSQELPLQGMGYDEL